MQQSAQTLFRVQHYAQQPVQRRALCAIAAAQHSGRSFSARSITPFVGTALAAHARSARVFSRSMATVNAAAAGAEDPSVSMKVVAEKVAKAARVMSNLSWVGFWGQLILSVVSGIIIVFSIVFKGVTKGTDAGLYFVLFGLLAAFLSVFWAMGYSRLAKKLKFGAEHPEQAPARTQVLQSLISGVTINIVGMGSTIIGLQATTGLLFAKTLSVAAQNPYMAGSAFNPVLALDIFLVQAAGNVMLAHFIGCITSLWLLRAISD